MSDTWVATDALGRDLAGPEEAGKPKKGRYVGMFYFMTHLNPDGSGPFDVSSPEDRYLKGLIRRYGYGDTVTLELGPQEVRIVNFSASAN